MRVNLFRKYLCIFHLAGSSEILSPASIYIYIFFLSENEDSIFAEVFRKRVRITSALLICCLLNIVNVTSLCDTLYNGNANVKGKHFEVIS